MEQIRVGTYKKDFKGARIHYTVLQVFRNTAHVEIRSWSNAGSDFYFHKRYKLWLLAAQVEGAEFIPPDQQ